MLSKIAYWLVWTALTAVVLVLVYRNTDWFKPAADKAVDSVKSVVSKVPIHKLHMAMDATMMPPQAQGQYPQQAPQSALTRH